VQGDRLVSSRSKSLPRDELYARVGLRLNRLLRHFAVKFGTLTIDVQGGTIKTISVSPTFMPLELIKMARLINVSPQDAPSGSTPAIGGAKRRKPHRFGMH
jgi:hypothetical protein